MSFIKLFQSLAPNDTHKLLVTVSKHYHLLKGDLLTWQKKKMEVSLHNYHRTGKRHVIHYLLMDEATGCLYGETHSAEQHISAVEFLVRAWSQKDGLDFCGIPKTLLVPHALYTGEVEDLLQRYRVAADAPASGFDAGIRNVRIWEDEINSIFYKHPKPPLKLVQRFFVCMSYMINERDYRMGAWKHRAPDKITTPPKADLVEGVEQDVPDLS